MIKSVLITYYKPIIHDTVNSTFYSIIIKSVYKKKKKRKNNLDNYIRNDAICAPCKCNQTAIKIQRQQHSYLLGDISEANSTTTISLNLIPSVGSSSFKRHI